MSVRATKLIVYLLEPLVERYKGIITKYTPFNEPYAAAVLRGAGSATISTPGLDINGKFADWDPAGKPLRVGLFVNDKESGAWTIYGEGGAIARVDTYREGDVVASVTYQDGEPLAQPAHAFDVAGQRGAGFD